MSIVALRWAREPRPGLGGSATAVLRDLADRANDTGVCWPSVSTIGADTSLSRRTVQRALRRLEAENLLRVHQITGRSSRIVLAVAVQADDEPASERRRGGVTVTQGGASVTPKASRSSFEAKPWVAPTKQNS